MSIFITHGNRLIDFANPQNSDIHIDDIIHHLAMIPRFGGKLDVHYSVLDHSVFAGAIAKTCLKVDDMTAFAVLMHDAQEAFLGDVTSPLKQLLPDYKKIEKAFEMVIRDKFKIRIKAEMEIVVKTADILALKAENKRLSKLLRSSLSIGDFWTNFRPYQYRRGNISIAKRCLKTRLTTITKP